MKDAKWLNINVQMIVIGGFVFVGLLALGVTNSQGQEVRSFSGKETEILDKQQVLENQDWWDNKDWSWYKANIPFFESPDPVIEEIYYYRWEFNIS